MYGIYCRNIESLVMSLDELSSFWARFDEVVSTRAPELFAQMAPPATEDEIMAAELALGFALPTVLRGCYRHHNGSGTAWILPGLFGVWCPVGELPALYVSLPTQSARVKRHRGSNTRIDDEWIQSNLLQPWPYHAKRLPFIRTMDREVVAADLFPGGTGTIEQIVHIGKSPASIALLAKSWVGLLSPLVDGLVDGSIYWGVESEQMGVVSWHYTKTRQPVEVWEFYPQACWLGYLHN